ncbi:N-acetyltransferase [Butyrivibrio sp. X503]|uniref:GNAT family N-acetyltransferase n=1 Tax=Butyrivibrio sp. X503 TaxID=2364878 RepID=UPI000EA8A6F5|nr:GNAT family N-acetyltransferase [Butyrivibrio sp. X503]RKM55462.1 N-acetyltransferase [Butyrivibrio sp. X503]
MTIEKVTVDDAAELLEIYAPYVEKTAISFEYEVPSIEEFKNRIINISKKYPYIKAVENGVIVGYAYANTFKERKAYDYSVETTIYVREDVKRNGIGMMLYAVLEKSLKDMGILNVNACIAYMAADELDEHLTDDSIRFHEKLGYKPVGIFHDSGYKFGTWYDMIWMEKMLSEHTYNPEPVRFGEWDII